MLWKGDRDERAISSVNQCTQAVIIGYIVLSHRCHIVGI